MTNLNEEIKAKIKEFVKSFNLGIKESEGNGVIDPSAFYYCCSNEKLMIMYWSDNVVHIKTNEFSKSFNLADKTIDEILSIFKENIV